MSTLGSRGSRRLICHGAAICAYLAVAACFWWPLPAQLATALPGPVSGDTGVYVWNLWVFRHEILAHHQLPFLTSEILSFDGDPGVPLTRHNYTTFANILAFPLIERIGLVTTFNLLTIASGVSSAYAMFLFAWARSRDAAAAFAGGLLFGFSPFLMVRSAEHFSLAQAAPLPIFGLLLLMIFQRPRLKTSVLAGVTVAWAYLSDPYYAVYCLLMAAFVVGYSVVVFEPRPEPVRRAWWPTVLTLAVLCVAGLIVGVVLSGGASFEIFGFRVSVRRLYTPVLVLTGLVILRVWLAIRANLTWRMPFERRHLLAATSAVLMCLVALAPVLYAMSRSASGRPWQGPPVWWRSSAPGVDLVAWFLPNPLHPWLGQYSAGWLASAPNGFVENVASLPWVALAIIATAWVWAGFRGTRGWWAFAALFALMSLGPFVRIAGLDTYVPTPWALLRYLPIVGAARMPTRLTVLVVMALSMLVALAVAHLRARSPHPGRIVAICIALLMVELLPAPRPVYPAVVPDVYRTIAADARDVRVLNLPFGLRDGVNSRGRFSTAYQYYQTIHEKPLIGGYVSRLPDGAIERYRRNPVLRVLLRLTERRPVDRGLWDAALREAPHFVARSRLAYVVVETSKAPPELVAFAREAFSLVPVQHDADWQLFRTEFR